VTRAAVHAYVTDGAMAQLGLGSLLTPTA
jgi:hypothetical protein